MAALGDFEDEAVDIDPTNDRWGLEKILPDLAKRRGVQWYAGINTLGSFYKDFWKEDWSQLQNQIDALFKWPSQFSRGATATEMEQRKLELESILASAIAPGGHVPGMIEKDKIKQVLRDVSIEMINHVDGVRSYHQSTVEPRLLGSMPFGKDRIRSFFILKLQRMCNPQIEVVQSQGEAVRPQGEVAQAIENAWKAFLPLDEQWLTGEFEQMYGKAPPKSTS